jgi:outer membrane lipoprotein SlyB
LMMSITDDVKARLDRLFSSPTLTVMPIGSRMRGDRGILLAQDSEASRLGTVVKGAFTAITIAAAMAMASPSHANDYGVSADVYSQPQRQVMQQGQATRMTVIGVRPVKIEVAPQARQSGSNMDYAVNAGASAVGALIGSQMGKSGAGRQVGAIVGGLAGLAAGNYANQVMRDGDQPRLVDGVELTMMNPQTNQVFAITQAGGHQFHEGDPVLVVTTNGASRVVADQARR